MQDGNAGVGKDDKEEQVSKHILVLCQCSASIGACVDEAVC